MIKAEVSTMGIDLKRKIYKDLEAWKQNPERLPLVIDGLRQVGKSYIVEKFAKEHYKNVITYDFRHRKEVRKIFNGDLEVDAIIRNSSPYFPEQTFEPYQTVLIFEEIGDCPLARTSLKSFAGDKRFDVLATGSLLGILNYRRKTKIDIPTGSETILEMSSLDFEEFLWANGLSEENVATLKEYIRKEEDLPEPLAHFYSEMIKRYIVVGGMPSAVKKFVASGNYFQAREELLGLIQDYRGDFGRFINDNNEEEIDYRLQMRLNQAFDSIPSQLARETDTAKFKFSEVKQGGRANEFDGVFTWLEKAGLVLTCSNLKAIETPLSANSEPSYFKAFLADPGLLMALYPLSMTQEFLSDTIGSRKGALYENLMATMIKKAGFPLYYFSRGSEHLEIDFIIEGPQGIVLLEEKSTNGKTAASKAVMEGRTKYHAAKCYKAIGTNFGKGDFFTAIPHCAVPFLLENMQAEMMEKTTLPPLKYPL